MSRIPEKALVWSFTIGAFCILPFVFSGYTLDPVLVPRFAFLGVLVSCIGLLLIYLLWDSQHLPLRFVLSNGLTIALIAWLVVAAWSLQFTRNLGDGIFEALRLGIYIAFFLIAATLFSYRRSSIDLCVKAILVLAIAINCVGCYQVYIISSGLASLLFPHTFSVGIESTFASSNIYAIVCFLMLPLIVYAVVYFRTIWRAIARFDLLVVVAGIVYLDAIAVQLALGVAVILTMVVIWRFRGRLGLAYLFQGTRVTAIILGVGAIMLCVGGVLWQHSDEIGDACAFFIHFNTPEIILGNFTDNSLFERSLMFHNSLALIRDNWLAGVGVSDWKIEMQQYGLGGHPYLNRGTIRFVRPHNDYLLAFAELGVVGLFCYLSMFFCTIKMGIGNLKAAIAKRDKILSLLLISGVFGFMIISFFYFPGERIFVSVLWFTMLGMIVGLRPKPAKIKLQLSKFGSVCCLGTIFLMGCLATAWGGIRLDKEKDLYKAYRAKFEGKWPETEYYINKAYSPTLNTDPTGTPLFWFDGLAKFNQGKTAEALGIFLLGEQVNPYHINLLNDAGSCYELLGDKAKARSYYQKALKITPLFPQALQNLSISLYNEGEYAEALRQFEQVETPHITGYAEVLQAICSKNIELHLRTEADTSVVNMLKRVLDDERLITRSFLEFRTKGGNFIEHILRLEYNPNHSD